ncbi:MAG: hypothetical protein WD491_04190 [Balneolales bacterium]
MTIKISKESGKKKLNEALKKMKPSKVLDANRHSGKVKWDEDALAYQKKIRDEWN